MDPTDLPHEPPAVPAVPPVDVDAAALLAALPDAVAVLGPTGTVVWANEQTARLLDADLAGLIGSDGFARLHPDELARAADGIAWSVAFPDRTAVVPYRLRRDDGSWAPVELKSSVLSGPDGEDLVVLVLRDGSTRSTLAEALASVARGDDVASTARWLVRAVERRWPFTRAAVVHDEPTGPHVTADGLPGPLVDALRPGLGDDGRPWHLAARAGGPLVVEDERLPLDLRAAASAAGFAACAAAPARDPHGAPAFVVAWFDEPAAAHMEWGHWSEEVTELLSLALERRAHQRDLWDGARRDPLTGLANRTAFFDDARRMVADAAADDDRDAALGVAYLDLDGFKAVNDRFGHLVGDRALRDVAARLAGAAATHDGVLLARLGGDEFVAATPVRGVGRAQVDAVAGDLVACLQEAFVLADEAASVVALGASVGVGVVRVGGTDPAAVVARAVAEADAAMYRRKHTARGAG